MDAMLSPVSRECTGDNEDWISVFRQRGVWQLTGDDIKRWAVRNAAFFDMLSRLVPPGGKVLEVGCGPGRHALAAATLGYRVVGIDIAPEIVDQAQANACAAAPDAEIEFQVGDMFDLESVARPGTFDAITHGGVMEHLSSAERIRDILGRQLAFAPTIVFDIPFDSPKNRRLFARDTIFRQLWTAEQWTHDVLAGLPVIESHIELHPADNMTDDLVVALAR